MNQLFDLYDRADIESVVDSFYQKLMIDEIVGHFFNKPNPIDLVHHLPVISEFWESVLFGTGSYRGNPMLKHIELNKIHKLEQKHFDQWLDLWIKTIQALFKGPIADEMITKAQTMAKLMIYKINQSSNKGFIQ